MSRHLKQFIYGTLFILIFAAVAGSGYFFFFKPGASCFDKIQNQGEEGVDCGGPCRQFCLPAAVGPIESIGRIYWFYIDENHSSLLAQIQNPNSELGARRFDYNFNIYGDQGELLGISRGQSFVYASEARYLFVPSVNVPTTNIERVEFNASNPAWEEPRVFKRPQLLIQNQNSALVGREIQVSGTLLNQDSSALAQVEIMALFFGKFGQIAAVSRTILDALTTGETRALSLIHI